MSDITTDFITATKRILAKVSSILTHIEVVEGDVKLIREQVVDNTDKPRTDTHASESEQQRLSAPLAREATQTKGNKNDGSNRISAFLRRQLKRWWKQGQRPKFQVAVITLIGLIAYTYETRRTNELTQRSLEFQRDSIAAELTIGDYDLIEPIVPNKHIGVSATVNNIGHSPALYGVEVGAFRWKDLPKAFPLVAPEPNIFLEPNVPGTREGIYDETPATEEFIYDIPRIDELTHNWTTRHLEPPLPRPAVFFVGVLVSDSLGVRTTTEFCFFVVRETGSNLSVPVPPTIKTDSRYVFIGCPKWNQTTREPIH
jgi:hypothetical protein